MKAALPLLRNLLGLTALLVGTVTQASTGALNVLSPQMEAICSAGAGQPPLRPVVSAKPLRVVAIGSSSTQGAGASRPGLNYVSQLAGQLNAVWTAGAQVMNEGVGGNTLADIVARAAHDLYAQHPNLVILQTGMNDALQKVPAGDYRTRLLSFVQDIQAHGLPVVLVDNQYVPGQVGSVEYQAIQQATHDVATATGSALVSRYGLSVALQRQLHLQPTDLLSGDGLHPNDLMHACTATALEATILKLSRSEKGARSGSSQNTPAL